MRAAMVTKRPVLKRCPFCGSKAALYAFSIVVDYHAGCTNKKCGVYTKDCDTKKEAIDVWNRRDH